MATVYLARDLKHGRLVAIKVLRAELAHVLGPERFLREIEIAARLQHPLILAVFDSGAATPPSEDSARCLWYAMPFIAGESLRDRLNREKQLSVEEAVRIACEVAQALGCAHAQGVIHRDIKPENILLSDGHALVADFGIAKALVTAGDQRLTETGWSMGTPPYMSPEQAQGLENIDHRSDIYAVGCMIFEMISGRPPFVGNSVGKVIMQHIQSPPPKLKELRDDAPEALDEIIRQALAKDRAARFQTADAMTEALRLVAAAETLERALPSGTRNKVTLPTPAAASVAPAPAAVTTPAPNRDRRLLIAVGALAFVAIAALVFVLLTRK